MNESDSSRVPRHLQRLDVSNQGSPSASPVRGDVTAAQWKAARQWMYDVKDPWNACILTLDGGGIRGYSSALILKRLMHEVWLLEQKMEEEEPTGELPQTEDDLLPCHYFDFMYGTSTGGLIAVMLARLRLSISECLDQYRLVGDRLFGHRRTIIPFLTKYRSDPLEGAVKELVKKAGLGSLHPWYANIQVEDGTKFGVENGPPRGTNIRKAVIGHASEPVFAPDMTAEPSPIAGRSDSLFTEPDGSVYYWDPNEPRVCQSCCLTAIHNGSVQQAHLLRSYPHYPQASRLPSWMTPYNPGADPLEIWQVTRATSAAPFYFDMLTAVVDGEMRGHKDGGIRENNPSGAAWSEYVSLYFPKRNPALLLSIGTGRTNSPPDGFMSAMPFPLGHFGFLRKIWENISVIPNLLVKYTESETQHQHMVSYAESENTWYKRLNVSTGLDSMSLDDWAKGKYHSDKAVPGGASLSRMEKATEEYLSRDVNKQFESFVAPKEMLKHAAEKLVRVRRARRREGGERWEYFIGKGLKERMAAHTNQEVQARPGAS